MQRIITPLCMAEPLHVLFVNQLEECLCLFSAVYTVLTFIMRYLMTQASFAFLLCFSTKIEHAPEFLQETTVSTLQGEWGIATLITR